MAEKMKTMTDMELDDEDSMDACLPMPCERPRWPYGLRICLTEKELKKLGFDVAEAEVGGTVHITGAMGEITSVSCNESDRGKDCRVEIQIQKLSIESEDAENDNAPGEAEAGAPKRKKAPLYG